MTLPDDDPTFHRNPHTTLLPELAALDDYRLAKNWSWQELSDSMKHAGLYMSPRTLHHLCRRAHVDATIRDRTLIKIRKFIQRRRIRVDQTPGPRPASHVALHPQQG